MSGGVGWGLPRLGFRKVAAIGVRAPWRAEVSMPLARLRFELLVAIASPPRAPGLVLPARLGRKRHVSVPNHTRLLIANEACRGSATNVSPILVDVEGAGALQLFDVGLTVASCCMPMQTALW
ncbi:hypothetical protein N9L68_00925 [bacterium]|nr:hypothetical protein [bacterium]